jgi:hypothetical protein
MAQWYGQFSGFNLSTKVEDAKDRLREAVASFGKAPAEDRSRRVKPLAAREAAITGGVDAILVEFGLAEIGGGGR